MVAFVAFLCGKETVTQLNTSFLAKQKVGMCVTNKMYPIISCG